MRCIYNARNKERYEDWKLQRNDLKKLPNEYRRVRNFLEHMDEAVHKGEISELEHCKFSRHAELRFVDRYGECSFYFSKEYLETVNAIWQKVIKILENRKNQKDKILNDVKIDI